MKIAMAEGDYFSIGSIVTCNTCHGQKISGEVIAFDHGSKMLAIKSNSTSGKANTHDVSLINLSMVSNVEVEKEATETPPVLSTLNYQKLQNRLRTNVEEKRRQAGYIGINVPPEAQQLVNFISKTISEVRWEDKNIVVMESVKISPPYGPDNCKGNEKALVHVKKLVEKHQRELSNSGSEHSSPQRSTPAP